MTKFWKKYILWFAQEHVDFRVAEFESLVKLFGLQFQYVSENRLVSNSLLYFTGKLIKTNFYRNRFGL